MASETAWGRVVAVHSDATEFNGADDSMVIQYTAEAEQMLECPMKRLYSQYGTFETREGLCLNNTCVEMHTLSPPALASSLNTNIFAGTVVIFLPYLVFQAIPHSTVLFWPTMPCSGSRVARC